MTALEVPLRPEAADELAASPSTPGSASRAGRASPGRDEFADAPILDEKATGHLRHIRNVLWREDGDWGPMVSNDFTQLGEFTAYYYQLSGMAHVLAQGYQHHLTAAPGVFRADMDRAIHKLQHPDVWSYWFAVSQGSPAWNPDLKAPQTPWWDPVVKENVMYSGHLNHVTALYAYLFDDARYDEVGSLRFEGFQDFGFGKAVAEYSLLTLNDLIYWQHVENGYMGVACQPNEVFVTCNQFPLWGLKWQDARLGGSRADEAVAGHFKAWERFGAYRPGEETPFLWLAAQNRIAPARTPGSTESAPGSFYVASPWSYWALHGANPDYALSTYDYITAAALDRDADGSLVIINEREMAADGKRYGRGARVLAGEGAPGIREYSGPDPRHAGIWGWFSLILSEGGDPRLPEILDYVDRNMNPTWKDGGYYYPRNDDTWIDGRFVGVTPLSGNANFAYARLNRKGGLNQLYNADWARARLAQPHLADVSRDVDIARATFLADRNALVVTARPPHGSGGGPARFAFANVRRQGQAWTLEVDGVQLAHGAPHATETHAKAAWFEDATLVVELPVCRAVDLVLRWT